MAAKAAAPAAPVPRLIHINDWVALRPRLSEKYLVAAFAFRCRSLGPAWASEEQFDKLFSAYKKP